MSTLEDEVLQDIGHRQLPGVEAGGMAESVGGSFVVIGSWS